MFYDPIKDRLGRMFSKRPVLQKAFYKILHTVFLRSWYVRREIDRLLEGGADRPSVEDGSADLSNLQVDGADSPKVLDGGADPSKVPDGRADSSKVPDGRADSSNVPGSPATSLDVLDAGTGFGQYAYYVARRFLNARVLAVDIKQDYLDNARRFMEQTPEGHRVEFEVHDLTVLDLDRSFDLILSVDVMEHIEDDRAVFRNFARVLKPGGHVVINTPSDLGGSDVESEGEAGFIEEHVRPGYNREELVGKLLDAGLEPVRVMYSYGRHGSRAWRLLIKWPMQMLARSKVSYVLLPIYYLAALPVGTILNALDVRDDNERGTGLLVVAKK